MKYDNVFTEIGLEIGPISQDKFDINQQKSKKQGWLSLVDEENKSDSIKVAFTTANGRHKRSVARALVYRGNRFNQQIMVNDLPLNDYFQNNSMLIDSIETFKDFIPATAVERRSRDYHPSQVNLTGNPKGYISGQVWVQGGGLSSQAIAVRLALVKALTKMGEEEKISLRKGGFVTTDARRKERKKYGLKKARKAPQFSKR